MNTLILTKKRLEKQYNNLTLEERLLKTRLFDLLKKLKPNAQHNRSYKQDIKLIEKSEIRLRELVNEIERKSDEIFEINSIIKNKTEKMSVEHSPIKKPDNIENSNLATASAATSTESIATASTTIDVTLNNLSGQLGAIPKTLKSSKTTPLEQLNIFTETQPITTPREPYNYPHMHIRIKTYNQI